MRSVEQVSNYALLQPMRVFFQNRLHLVPCLLTAVALVYAIGDRPYAVYQVLRVVTTATAALMVALSVVQRRWWVVWLFGIVAVLFNPVVPVQFRKAEWRWIDAFAGALFLVAGLVDRDRKA